MDDVKKREIIESIHESFTKSTRFREFFFGFMQQDLRNLTPNSLTLLDNKGKEYMEEKENG